MAGGNLLNVIIVREKEKKGGGLSTLQSPPKTSNSHPKSESLHKYMRPLLLLLII